MAFGLTIGTERATALQNSIQDELTRLGYSAEAVIGSDFGKSRGGHSRRRNEVLTPYVDSAFVDWLFAEVSKGVPEAEVPVAAAPELVSVSPAVVHDDPPHLQSDTSRRGPGGNRTGNLYQHAITQAIPNPSPTAQKRSASARSPSPTGHINKSRRTDLLPTGPRAMQRDGNPLGGSRSLLERMGPSRNGHPHPPYAKDDIQARIDNITGSPAPDMGMMMGPGGFPMNGVPGMDMNAMAMANPLMLQDMLMNQMALMSQMAGAIGMMNSGMNVPGPYPMQQQGMGGEMGMNGGTNGMDGAGGRGRGRGRGGSRGMGRGRGGHTPATGDAQGATQPTPTLIQAPSVVAPTPMAASSPFPNMASPQITPSNSQGRQAFVPPDRPLSPTLCKFGLKCTNAVCRWSHPSPVATPESGVVLSNEPCENGKNCKDKDCVKAHGRVLPSTFHRGLAPTGGMVSVQTPEAGSMGAPSPHRSVTFNKSTPPPSAAELEKRMKEVEEKRILAKAAVAEAQAAAAGKKDDASRPTSAAAA
ncbi:hypothetical protein PHLCEN_2v10410 [Hermanssonia centrifuga]|uniref:Nab2 type CCCH zinc finger 4 domain-containing protein n=2 Tax=Hermanssonia centrifuga TaxID=98765 RepID=A0A2R6NNA0_9APHY|nr:hypothetical protein PHLCEN_2v10410 [Hermanssonia centrifuga]